MAELPNYDEKTGIRYGVISPHAISQYALDDIYTSGTDPYYETAKKDLLESFESWCDDNNLDFKRINTDSIEDSFNDNYTGPEDGTMDYSDSEYDLHVSGDNFGIFVMRSPYYTYCRNCSPCAPGAGDLNSPVDNPDLKNKDMIRYIDLFGAPHKIAEKTLCLGPEWFNKESPIPYRVFRVDNDVEVI